MAAEQGRMGGYLRAIIDALPHPEASYCVIGALAVNAWGRVRATEDIDLLVLSQESLRSELLDSLQMHGFRPDLAWIEQNPMTKDRVLRLGHSSYPDLPLDVIFSADHQEESALSRRRRLDVFGVDVWVCSSEDLILLKLKAGRPIDFNDVMGIVKNPRLQLDLAYLWDWADRLGLRGELQYVLQAAAPPK